MIRPGSFSLTGALFMQKQQKTSLNQNFSQKKQFVLAPFIFHTSFVFTLLLLHNMKFEKRKDKALS